MPFVKNHAYNVCYPVCLWQCSVRVESVYALWGAEGLGRCLVLWWSIFLAVVGAEFHADLLLWLPWSRSWHRRLITTWNVHKFTCTRLIEPTEKRLLTLSHILSQASSRYQKCIRILRRFICNADFGVEIVLDKTRKGCIGLQQLAR